ncbi:MAG: discoidin domain-containing protein, partial [Agathobacter sp.]|nr:discoidin domain-containing protein [Agathobacter sp.]
YTNNHGFQGYDAELYAENKDLTGLQWAVDEAYYRSLKRNADNTIEYIGKTGIYKAETPGRGWTSSTLLVSSIEDANRVQVWIAEGEYLRREGYFMRDGVDVYGGFPGTGNPGMYERQPRTYDTIIETNTTEEVANSDFNNWGNKLSDSSDGFISLGSKGWKIVNFSSEETGQEDGRATNVIDGNENTIWHTIYSSGNGTQTKSPHYITIDFGKVLPISEVNLKTRNYGFTTTIYLSESLDDIDSKQIKSYSYANGAATISILLDNTVNARYLKMVFKDPKKTNFDYVDLKEIGVNGEYGASGSYSGITHDLNSYKYAYEGNRVLTQPFPYYVYESSVGSGDIAHMELKNKIAHGFVYDTSWDGLIIQNGRVRMRHQRDGGAGLALRYNGHIKNCIIRNNVNTSYTNTRGGGCFQNDGIIENCIFTGNDIAGTSGTYVYGGALYLRSGIVFNTLFSGNKLSATGVQDPRGTAIFFEVAKFYNNTITGNVGANTVYSGDYFARFGYSGLLEIYNTIIYHNTTTNNTKELDFTTNKSSIKITDCVMENSSAHKSFSGYTGIKNIYYMDDYSSSSLFKDESAGDYSLHSTSPAINKGTEELGNDLNNKKVYLPSYDANYDARVQDCTVDIGAYEFNGAYSITPDETTNAEQAVFYVTQNGRGTGSAANPENAACWTKLQKVLDAAGRYLEDNPSTTRKVIVKLAGDAPNANGEYSGFVYRPRRSNKVTASGQEVNTRDFTIIVPHGVEVWGGYSDAFTSADNN